MHLIGNALPSLINSSYHSPKSAGIAQSNANFLPLVPINIAKRKLSFVPQNNHERVRPEVSRMPDRQSRRRAGPNCVLSMPPHARFGTG